MPEVLAAETAAGAGAFSGLAKLFRTPVWQGDGFALTPRAILFAAVLLLAGAFIARRLSRFSVARMPGRISDNCQTAAWVRRFVFALVLCPFLVWAFNILGIPLTAFAFVGGALAIGFGFGAQTLCTNLIAGVILFFERPFRAGDTLDIAGSVGTVRQIGLRATEIRMVDGVTLFVPNSQFLSDSIRNRAAAGNILRGSVAVSADYGSDSRKVEAALLAVAAADSRVLRIPDRTPWVVFNDFADSSLDFTLFYWVDTATASLPVVASDLRHAILERFRADGISIPFPQLDVHLPPQPPAK
jgi:small-conductance mechanosensitive channel